MNKTTTVKNFFKSELFIVTVLIAFKALLARYFLFDKIDITGTILLELSFILIFTTIVELIAIKGKPFFYLVLNLLFSTMFLGIILYQSFFGRIVDYFALSLIGQVEAVSDSVYALIRPEYALFFIDIIVLIVLLVFRKYPMKNVSLNKAKVVLPIFILAIIVSTTNFMIQKDVIMNDSVAAAEKQGILNYEAIAIYVGPETRIPVELEVEVEEEDEGGLMEEIREVKEIEYIPEEERKYFGAAKGKNLVAIQIESMQNFPIGLEVDGKEITPHLNDLLSESFYFSKVFQQTGPGNTSDAEFMMNVSLYPVAYTPTSETYGDRAFPSLPRLLKEEGYKSMTFHADEIEYWNRDELYPALGFDEYYDETFFDNEDVIRIGPSDRVLLQKSLPVLKELHDNGTPFYAHLVGLTSHHPFTMPAKDVTLELPEHLNGTLTGDYLKSINYMDRVIHEFMEEMKAEGMYEDTMFVIYGDHAGLYQSAIGEKETDLITEILGHEYKTVDRLNLPFIIHAPGVTDGQEFNNIGGQLDIMPTVANLLGLSLDDIVIFGQDLVNHYSNLVGVRYYLPIGSFFNDEIVFISGEGFDDGEAYDIYTEEEIEDFQEYKDDYKRVLTLEKLSDEYMKTLPKR
ncbi:LTA synthase family protein [Gracilibacillus dipsosauri]|uniref:LTA synthase family protein n=1 Tax=Gracilibacillus dipsosauri TaxID=178340 RepID=UPI00240A2265